MNSGGFNYRARSSGDEYQPNIESVKANYDNEMLSKRVTAIEAMLERQNRELELARGTFLSISEQLRELSSRDVSFQGRNLLCRTLSMTGVDSSTVANGSVFFDKDDDTLKVKDQSGGIRPIALD